MELHWVVALEHDGEYELKVDGQHFGVVRPHHDGYCKIVWDWSHKGWCPSKRATRSASWMGW